MRVHAGFGSEVRRVGFSADGTLLAAETAHGERRAWDVATGQARQAPPEVPFVDQAADGHRLALCGGAGVRVFDLRGPDAAELAWRRRVTRPDVLGHFLEIGRTAAEGDCHALVWHLLRLPAALVAVGGN